VAKLALETGCPIIPTAVIGSRELQKPGQVIPSKGSSMVMYGRPITVEKKNPDDITHDELRSLTDRVTEAIRKLSGQDYVDEYAQKAKARLQAQESSSDTAEHETH
jgi:1-acyl-sn-glycerol-3-phosphate acyltransferase